MWCAVCFTKRYGLLRRPTFRSCEGLQPSAIGGYYVVLDNFWPPFFCLVIIMVTLSNDLNNVKKNLNKTKKKSKTFFKSKFFNCQSYFKKILIFF